jgi:alpha-ketoglutaric semialdehyde dehydrogenase
MHKHLIAGRWIDGPSSVEDALVVVSARPSDPGSVAAVNAACEAAEEAFWSFGYSTRAGRARFLDAIADEIEARGAEITRVAVAETGLPEARLEGERGRTTGQLRLFARMIEAGDHLDIREDAAVPDRQPAPRPRLSLVQRPIGPVAVFGASNFPLAFSVAGGDTASALAAGCPVVVKGHPAHPGTGKLVAEAVLAAIEAEGLHPGVFSLVQDGSREAGQALVIHPLIRAVGFTGSLAGGRALFDLCAARDEPIPFFGELGSVNPMFLLPNAVAARGAEIAAGWAGSLTLGAGQFCTNPGIAVVLGGADADAIARDVVAALAQTKGQTMLTDAIAQAYRAGCKDVAGIAGIEELHSADCSARVATPCLYRTTGRTWLKTRALGEEVFGPLGLIVEVETAAEMREIAESLEGQLTCTIHMEEADTEAARALTPVLERKAGRVLCNGFPTGVEVCDAMVHGGPYPASTNFGHTSVGTLAIRRWLRPVCYQNMPDTLLPLDLT